MDNGLKSTSCEIFELTVEHQYFIAVSCLQDFDTLQKFRVIAPFLHYG